MKNNSKFGKGIFMNFYNGNASIPEAHVVLLKNYRALLKSSEINKKI
jgi:hypothetical protein